HTQYDYQLFKDPRNIRCFPTRRSSDLRICINRGRLERWWCFMTNKIPEDVIENIRKANDIVDVVGEYVQLNKQGRNYFGRCPFQDRKSTRLNSSHVSISYAVFCLKKKI